MTTNSKILLAILAIIIVGGIVWAVSGSSMGTSTTATSTATGTGTTGQTVNSGPLAIGGSTVVNGTKITALALVQDSRCPVDVQCIQAGTVQVKIAVDALNSSYTLTLGQSQTIGGAVITLVSVTPAKNSKVTLAPSDYSFVFSAASTLGGTTTTTTTTTTTGAPIVGAGAHCGGNINNAPVCGAGYHCQLVVSRPDTGGTCVADASGVRGIVSTGPTCPVQTNPPTAACADKPYATTITVMKAGSTATYMTTKSISDGTYTLALPAGSYTLSAKGGTTYPRCAVANITVSAGAYTTTNITCDTGIR